MGHGERPGRIAVFFAAALCVAAAPRPRVGMLVSAEWLVGRARDPRVVVLHVARERAHYDAGHVPGARYLPWSELVVTRNGLRNELPAAEEAILIFQRRGVTNRSRVILYGDMLGLSAARAYFTLDYLGLGDRAALLDGGLEKWRAEGRPISTDEPPPAPQGKLKVRLRPRVLAMLDEIREFSRAAEAGRSAVTLLDTRPPAQYTGESADGSPRRGHIPGARSVYWMENLPGRENPVLRPTAELAQIYTRAGIEPGRTVVTYCTSGVQASQSYFTLKYLGYDVRMYDGSFSEWSRAGDAPVVTGVR